MCCCRTNLQASSFLLKGFCDATAGSTTRSLPSTQTCGTWKELSGNPFPVFHLSRWFLAFSTVVLRRSCRISRQLPIAMANLEIDSYLGLLSLPNSLPVADWAIGLNSSLAFSSFVYPHPCWYSWWADYTFPHYDFSTWLSDLVWPGDSGEQDTSRSLKCSLLGFSHPHVEKHLPASLSTQVLEWVIWSRTIPTGPKWSKDTWARNKCCRPLELCSC